MNTTTTNTKSYKQARKTPKSGWKYADDESMCAATADTIAMYCCMNRDSVYNWIRKHFGTDWRKVYSLRGTDSIPYYDLVPHVLNDTCP